MGLVSNVNRILNAKSTGVFLFGFTGAYKVLTDYQRAPKNEKKTVLLRDSAILAGSALGLAAYASGRKSFVNSAFKKNTANFVESSFNKLKDTKFWRVFNNAAGQYLSKPTELVVKNAYNVTKDCVDNVLFVASGILGAVAADSSIQFSHSNKTLIDNNMERKSGIKINHTNSKPISNEVPKPITKPVTSTVLKPKSAVLKQNDAPFSKLKDKIKNNTIQHDFKHFDNFVDENTKKNIISNITNMPEMRIFNNTMVGLQSFQVAEEKTFKDKLKHTTRSLVTNTLVPMFFLSLASNLTKGMKPILRLPLVFTSMVAGTMYTNKKIENKMGQYMS